MEETIEQLVVAVKKLEKTICWCHNQLLLSGPHYAPGEEEEVLVDSEEEEDDDDGLKYKTDTPLMDSYTTPPSTAGCLEPSPQPTHSPTPEDSDPEDSTALCTTKLKAHIELFLEEVEEDMELNDLPLLENITLLQVPVPNPLIPGFVPFAMSTSQHCMPPNSLLRKVYNPYNNSVE